MRLLKSHFLAGGVGVSGGGSGIPQYEDDAFVDLSTDAGGGDDIVLTYPAGIEADDIAFIHVSTVNSFSTSHNIEAPSGWNEAYEGVFKDEYRHGLFWKRLTGSESGTITVHRNAL
jgi:hypothetical protein